MYSIFYLLHGCFIELMNQDTKIQAKHHIMHHNGGLYLKKVALSLNIPIQSTHLCSSIFVHRQVALQGWHVFELLATSVAVQRFLQQPLIVRLVQRNNSVCRWQESGKERTLSRDGPRARLQSPNSHAPSGFQRFIKDFRPNKKFRGERIPVLLRLERRRVEVLTDEVQMKLQPSPGSEKKRIFNCRWCVRRYRFSVEQGDSLLAPTNLLHAGNGMEAGAKAQRRIAFDQALVQLVGLFLHVPDQRRMLLLQVSIVGDVGSRQNQIVVLGLGTAATG